MTPLGVSVAIVSVGASVLSAPAPSIQRGPALRPPPVHTSSVRPAVSRFHPPETFQKYCFECHGGEKHRGDVSIERLIQQSAESSIGDYWDLWDTIAEKIETKEMPPEDK